MGEPETLRYEFVEDAAFWRRQARAFWTYGLLRQRATRWILVGVGVLCLVLGGFDVALTGGWTLVILGVVAVGFVGLTVLLQLLLYRSVTKRLATPGATCWAEYSRDDFTMGSPQTTSTYKYDAFRSAVPWGEEFVALLLPRMKQPAMMIPVALMPVEVQSRIGHSGSWPG